MKKAKCPICRNSFYMGWNGTIDGCDECTGTVRDSYGNAWSPDETYHEYLVIGTNKTHRVFRYDVLMMPQKGKVMKDSNNETK